MTHNQPPTGDAPFNPQTHELSPDALEGVLQPDTLLAAQSLDRDILAAESDPQADQEALELLHLQRSLVDMSPNDANRAASDFAQRTGKYATFWNTQHGSSVESLHYPINRDFFVPRVANEERWRVVGIDTSQYSASAVGRAYLADNENAWREARIARRDLQAAQTTQAKTMERASHLRLPVDEPGVTA